MDTGSPSKSTLIADTDRGAAGRGAAGHRAALPSRYRRLWLYSVFFTAFVSLTPLVLMTFVNFRQYKTMLAAEIIHPISRLTSDSKRFMEDFLQERRAALTYIVNRETYQDLCDQEALNRLFQNVKRSFGGFVDLGVYDSDGNQRSYTGPLSGLEGKNYKDQDWFREVRVKGIYVSDVFLGYRNVPHFVIAVEKDNTETGGFYILRATIDTEVPRKYTSSLHLRPSSDVFLINREGILQTPSWHHGDVLEQCPIAPPPYSSKTEVLEVKDNKGDPALIGYAYIDESPFIFVLVERSEDIMRSWLNLRGDILLLLCTSIVLIMAVILWSSTSLVNRIRDADYRRNEALQSMAFTDKMASLGRIAAGVAHEINNPLAIINENAGLLKDLLSLQQEQIERDRLLKIADTVLKSVARCSVITHRMLGFAKRMEPLIERIALGPLLEEVLSFQGKEADYRSITVNLTFPDDLPTIESDRGQLQQVFLNIVNNAYAAVNDGGRIDIVVALEDQNTIAVTVTDDGPGIPKEHLDHIFEPFFSTKAESGTGLGLSITFGIVERLGGRITAQNKPDGGARFTVRLPVTRRV